MYSLSLYPLCFYKIVSFTLHMQRVALTIFSLHGNICIKEWLENITEDLAKIFNKNKIRE